MSMLLLILTVKSCSQTSSGAYMTEVGFGSGTVTVKNSHFNLVPRSSLAPVFAECREKASEI